MSVRIRKLPPSRPRGQCHDECSHLRVLAPDPNYRPRFSIFLNQSGSLGPGPGHARPPKTPTTTVPPPPTS